MSFFNYYAAFLRNLRVANPANPMLNKAIELGSGITGAVTSRRALFEAGEASAE